MACVLKNHIEAQDAPAFMGFMGPLVTPKFIEVIGGSGILDAIWLDQEHAAISPSNVENLIRAAKLNDLDVLVRVPATNYASIMRPLEAGAAGLIIPQVRTMDQVHDAVSWSLYPPKGIRGLFQGNTEANFGRTPVSEHIDQANNRLLLIQIETPEAVDLASEIMAVDGVDGLFVGPGDLACTLGVPGEVMHPKCINALKQVALAAKTHNKWWGGLVRDETHANLFAEQGCRLFSVLGDYGLVLDGLTVAQQRFAKLMEQSI